MLKNIVVILTVLLGVNTLYAQNHTQVFKVIDQQSKEVLIGATVQLKRNQLGAVTNMDGIAVLTNISEGTDSLSVRYIGYLDHNEVLNVPSASDTILIALIAEVTELDDLVISVTRTGRTIEVAPTRVEMIDGEELGEKAAMNSANIAVLLKESTGIQMQQTSAASGNKSIRIQGLDGRHTQIVKDGFPLFGGFAGGLSIMQIPPLDLQRVEVIKGSSSTLFGGGAIAGVVNLVTRTPADEREVEFMLDQTSALKTTVNSFYSDQKGKLGWTLYSSGNFQKAYDVDDDHFSEIPETKGVSINPSLFWNINKTTKLRLSLIGTFENRKGGDLQAINDEVDTSHTFLNENNSKRLSYQLNFGHRFNDYSRLNVKNSISFFNRSIDLPSYAFAGEQIASFSEVSYTKIKEKSEWILGGNFYVDQFDETSASVVNKRSYSNNTLGAFGQFNQDLGEKLVLEAGMRLDYNSQYGAFLLPRVSMLFNLGEQFSSRVGGGFGYKTPTIFTEQTEEVNFQGIEPLDPDLLASEQSRGVNWDFNYTADLGGDWSLSVNQLFYFTQLQNSLVLEQGAADQFVLANANGNVNSAGFETNIKLKYKDFKLFANYAFVNTELKYDNINKQKPLTARHNIGAVLVYEQEGKWRIGYELYYTGRQNRSDFTKTRDFAEMGVMIMRNWDKFSLYLNFENFADTRQSRYEPVAFGDHATPNFREIWSPTEGRVINGGVILRL